MEWLDRDFLQSLVLLGLSTISLIHTFWIDKTDKRLDNLEKSE